MLLLAAPDPLSQATAPSATSKTETTTQGIFMMIVPKRPPLRLRGQGAWPWLEGSIARDALVSSLDHMGVKLNFWPATAASYIRPAFGSVKIATPFS